MKKVYELLQKSDKPLIEFNNETLGDSTMNKKEIIEEMAKGILRLNKKINTYCALHSCEECLNTFPYPDCEEYNFAQSAVILGYRKIPEGSVVLDRHEAQKYYAYKHIEPQIKGYLDRERELENKLKQSRKETAKEIIEIIKEMDGADLNYIAQKYGVEE